MDPGKIAKNATTPGDLSSSNQGGPQYQGFPVSVRLSGETPKAAAHTAPQLSRMCGTASKRLIHSAMCVGLLID
jgi:hypothetical protein